MSGDSWCLQYDACVRLGQDVMEKIAERNRQQKGSSHHTKLSAHIRTDSRQFSKDLSVLRDDLIRSARISNITQRELERRQSMLDQLVTKEKQLDQAFKTGINTDYTTRTSLLGNNDTYGNDAWGVSDNDRDPLLPVEDIRQGQQQMIREQDRGLEALSSVVSRQKQIALDIGNEVDLQNEIVEDITEHTVRTDRRIRRSTQHIKIIDRKSSTCYQLSDYANKTSNDRQPPVIMQEYVDVPKIHLACLK